MISYGPSPIIPGQRDWRAQSAWCHNAEHNSPTVKRIYKMGVCGLCDRSATCVLRHEPLA